MASSSDDDVDMADVAGRAAAPAATPTPSKHGDMPATLKDALEQPRAQYKYSKFDEAKSYVSVFRALGGV